MELLPPVKKHYWGIAAVKENGFAVIQFSFSTNLYVTGQERGEVVRDEVEFLRPELDQFSLIIPLTFFNF